MVRCGVFPLVVNAAIAAALCAPLPAQTSSEQQIARVPSNSRPVPPPVDARPFALGHSKLNSDSAVEFRSPDQITESDRLLLADAESSITEHAAFAGFDFDKTNWTYQQVVCPALPNHLFLQFMRNNGVGDLTVFSASVPRNGQGRVRVIPILRRGYSLWSPAPINAMTISAFNHIRVEEGRTKESQEEDTEWLGNGLCYAALAGARPQIISPDVEPTLNKPIPALIAVMDVNTTDKDHEEVIRFADAAALPHPMEWTMTFTRDGRLVKATHTSAAMWKVRPVPQEQ
jgi:hypothetical protein